MIAFDSDSLCREARIYHYDFLCDESRKTIPPRYAEHIKQCANCQGSINRLAALLSEAEEHSEPEQEEKSSALTTMLRLHFAYINERVTCKTVKPFLPGRLHPDMEIRIPTPITAHLDNCPQCAGDLERIRELGLNREQLCRLSQLFAQSVAEDGISCSQAQAGILAVALMALHETNKEVLKHLCTCQDCREALYQYRGTLREQYLHEEVSQAEFPCNEVSSADLFDYVIPYGLDPARDEYTRLRRSFISHVRCCPTCLAKMQQLHDTVYEIAEREESDVVTIYHLRESAETEGAGEFSGRYAGFPISVEITSCRQPVQVQPFASISSIVTAVKAKVSTVNFGLLVKVGFTAGVVILVAFALLLNIPTAKAVTVGQIYTAIGKVSNIYIASFVPLRNEPVQEQWISRTFKIHQMRTKTELVLWDLGNKVRKEKDLDTGSIKTYSVSDNTIAAIEKGIYSALGIPFDMSEIPQNAKWSRVAGDSRKTDAQSLEVYDLEWIEEDYGSPRVFWRWRVSVDLRTNLPHRVELYKRSSDDIEYSRETVIVVKYPSDSEIETVIKDARF